MNLKSYIYNNYKEEFGKEVPLALKFLLDSYYASDVKVDDFIKHFALEGTDFKVILAFIMDDGNAYELAKYGARCHESNQYNDKNERKKTASDDYGYGEADKFTKRFR